MDSSDSISATSSSSRRRRVQIHFFSAAAGMRAHAVSTLPHGETCIMAEHGRCRAGFWVHFLSESSLER